jgi:hypothetical protein
VLGRGGLKVVERGAHLVDLCVGLVERGVQEDGVRGKLVQGAVGVVVAARAVVVVRGVVCMRVVPAEGGALLEGGYEQALGVGVRVDDDGERGAGAQVGAGKEKGAVRVDGVFEAVEYVWGGKKWSVSVWSAVARGYSEEGQTGLG